ncbi:MAG: AMP-binding protein, partial [Thermocrispum sp.]
IDLVRVQAEARPEKAFVFDSTVSLSYAELHEQALRLALGLHRAGLRQGDRVAVQLPNWAEFVMITAALSRIGAILVPIMPIYRDDEVGFVLQHSGAKAAITCEEFKGFRYIDMFAELQKSSPELGSLITVRGSGTHGATALEDLVLAGDLATVESELPPAPSPDDGFMIVYTSGTTSRPKGCFHTFNTVRASAEAIVVSLGYGEDDVQFGPSPITHATGLVTSCLMPLLVGASSHLMESWDPEDGLRRIEKHGCTVSVTATAFLQMLMGAYDADKHDAGSIRFWVCAGSPIPSAVVRKATDLLSGGQVLSLYGRSENFLTTMCTREDPPERSATSDGSAVAGAEVKVVGLDGAEVPRGQEGDIAYRGPSHMLEYFHDDEQTQALFTPDGFSRSGDLGVMDADGYVRVTGRLKDIIIRGGLNISAREIEEQLIDHPSVANVAVVSMPDERLGEKVCAYVVLAPSASSLTLAEVAEFLQERKVATPKLPERLELIGALPMTASGKVRKHVLRDDVAGKLGSVAG